MIDEPAGQYPVAHGSHEYEQYKTTAPARVHGIYEEQMLEVDTLAALQAVDAALSGAKIKDDVANGWQAARATFQVMSDAHDRLDPETILDADDPSLSDARRAARLWADAKIRAATVESLAQSVRTLARLWASAWKAGNGKAIAASKLKAFTESVIQTTYKKTTFAPAMTLDDMVQSGKFEVP